MNGFLLMLAMVVMSMPAYAKPQDPQGNPGATEILRRTVNGQSGSEIRQEYVLGVGDVIEVTIMGIPGLEKQEFTLDGEGRISLPYIKQVRLRGLTAHDAQVAIAALFEVSLLENPQVSVRIKEYRSKFYWMLGAVSRPGRYPIAGQVFLVDALTSAGGLTEKADVQVRIRRGDAANDPEAEAAPEEDPLISLTEVFYSGDPKRNIEIYSGDVITVPERKEYLYYVVGDVGKQGSYPIEKGEKPMLSRAVAQAGGVLKTAAPGNSLILRPIPGSEMPMQIKVDVKAVLKGQKPDIELQQNDIVYVPGSATKAVGRGLLGGMSGIFSTLLLIGIR